MTKVKFTKEQIKELSKNKNIAKCSDKSITYNNDFMIKAVKQYYDEYLVPKEIFIQAGFNLEMIGKDTPGHCLDRWKKKYQNKGDIAFNQENRGKGKGGGRPRKYKNESNEDKIKRLEATVIYLKAENDFLAKLRAKNLGKNTR